MVSQYLSTIQYSSIGYDKNKSPIQSYQAILVAGVVLPGLRPGECHFGDALLSGTRTRYARNGLFLPLRLHDQVLDAQAIKNPAKFFAGFLVVDYTIEPLARRSQISNLDLLKDLVSVTRLLEF